LVVGDIQVSIGDLHNGDRTHLVNLAFGAALSSWLGADPEAIARAARGFRPGKHRREVVAEIDGVVWVDDSKATNPHAAIASIRSRDSVVLIAGGLAKGIDVSPIAREPNLRAVIGIGEAGPGLAEAAGAVGQSAETLDMAVRIAAGIAKPGDTVLLAPGCASFDQFESYVVRGDRFQELVNQLILEVNAR